jgi:DNA-binding IclR family transcriptional regulator
MARTAKKSTAKPVVTYATPALEKGLDILELLSKERDGLTKSEVARELGRTVSEIFRMLYCLEQRGYISLTESDRYVLSLRLFQLVQEHPPTERILAEALPRMQALAGRIQQSVHLGVLDGPRVVILAQANAPGSVGFYVKQGASVDLLQAASGQAILAHLPQDAIERVLQEWEVQNRQKTPADFYRTLEQIRRKGYEQSPSYQVKGITNISHPVLDNQLRAIAAITVPYIQRMDASPSLDMVKKELAQTAKELSAAMGLR